MMLLSFLLGVLAGMAFVVGYGTYQIVQLKKIKGELVQKIKDKLADTTVDAEKMPSIKDRLMLASRIADTQMELRAQAEMPSKNALHSRHKNGLVGQINELEAQKISILKTVLGDGFDPMITTIKEGGAREDIPLSSYVAQSEEMLNSNTPQTSDTNPEATNHGPRKAGKFVIYTGGRKDDGTTH